MTCNDCIHFIVCEKACHLFDEQDVEKRCKHIKNKADFVEVVRCKDCDIPHNKWTGCPKLNGLIPPPDFFCGHGERRKK